MRTLTTAQEAAQGHPDRTHHLKVEVQNGSGTFIDLSEWLVGGSWDDEVSHPVPQLTLRFRREDGQGRSLSKLMEGSLLNVDDAGAYAPQIEEGREVKLYAATLLPGNEPADADWGLLFHGTIDEDDPAQGSHVEIVARDKIGAHLVDRHVEDITDYGSDAGTAIETVMQDILDDWTDGITLYSENGTAGTPFAAADSPGFLVTTTPFGEISVMDALERLAQLIGWAVRPKWNESVGAFVLTFYEPDRTKAVTDWTFGPSDYMALPRLRSDVKDVRNVVEVEFTSSTGRATYTAEDAASIADYGRRWMRFIEGSDSPINTLAEATTMGDAALSDLKDVEAEQEIELPFFWPAQREDLFGFLANGVHYDADQEWAVTGITHDLSPLAPRTRIRVRGAPAGMYRQWRGRKGARSGTAAAGPAVIEVVYMNLSASANAVANVALRVDDGSFGENGTLELWTNPSDTATPNPRTDAPDASLTVVGGQTVAETGSGADVETAALTDIVVHASRKFGEKRIFARWTPDTSNRTTGIRDLLLVRQPGSLEERDSSRFVGDLPIRVKTKVGEVDTDAVLADADQLDPAITDGLGRFVVDMFEKGTDDADDVLPSPSRTFIAPGSVDASLRPTKVRAATGGFDWDPDGAFAASETLKAAAALTRSAGGTVNAGDVGDRVGNAGQIYTISGNMNLRWTDTDADSIYLVEWDAFDIRIGGETVSVGPGSESIGAGQARYFYYDGAAGDVALAVRNTTGLAIALNHDNIILSDFLLPSGANESGSGDPTTPLPPP